MAVLDLATDDATHHRSVCKKVNAALQILDGLLGATSSLFPASHEPLVIATTLLVHALCVLSHLVILVVHIESFHQPPVRICLLHLCFDAHPMSCTCPHSRRSVATQRSRQLEQNRRCERGILLEQLIQILCAYIHCAAVSNEPTSKRRARTQGHAFALLIVVPRLGCNAARCKLGAAALNFALKGDSYPT